VKKNIKIDPHLPEFRGIICVPGFLGHVYFVFAMSTDAECSKKDYTRLAKEYASVSEDEAGKIWQSASYWSEPYDVYTIADD